jgi:hypothetical protein
VLDLTTRDSETRYISISKKLDVRELKSRLKIFKLCALDFLSKLQIEHKPKEFRIDVQIGDPACQIRASNNQTF